MADWFRNKYLPFSLQPPARTSDTSMEDITKCAVCLSRFRLPTILQCGHSFCNACCSKVRQCPLCRAQIRSRIKNHSLHDIMSHLYGDQNTGVEDDVTADNSSPERVDWDENSADEPVDLSFWSVEVLSASAVGRMADSSDEDSADEPVVFTLSFEQHSSASAVDRMDDDCDEDSCLVVLLMVALLTFIFGLIKFASLSISSEKSFE